MSVGYQQTLLVSNVAGLAAVTDPNLTAPRGLASDPTGPIWVGAATPGTPNLPLNPTGATLPSAPVVVVEVPPPPGSPPGSPSTPTGVVDNDTPGFGVASAGQSGPSRVLIATAEGTIAAWSPGLPQAVLAVDHSASGAAYLGLALATDSQGQPLLYATNFSAGTIEVFDSDFQPAAVSGSFTDPDMPAGFAPFGIRNIGGRLYVTYAAQDATGSVDVPGPGNGFIDVFDGDGVLQGRLVSGGPLNSPWGLALVPGDFGDFRGALLVGNSGDGRINAFDPGTGRFLGQLEDPAGQPLTIDHLWGLDFGNVAPGGNERLYFSAGTAEPPRAVLGMLRVAPTAAGGPTSAGGSGGTGSTAAVTAPVNATPAPAPLLFLLREPSPNGTPALSVLSGPRSDVPARPGTALRAPTPSPAAFSPSDRAALDSGTASLPNRPTALDTVRALPTGPDIAEQILAATAPPFEEASAEGGPNANRAPADFFAGDTWLAVIGPDRADPVAIDGDRPPQSPTADDPPAVPNVDPPDRQHCAGRPHLLGGSFFVASLLISGGVFLSWEIASTVDARRRARLNRADPPGEADPAR